MPKVGGRRKKHRTHREYDTEAEQHIPKSFVFKKGKVSGTMKELVQDFRKCMYPNTAMKLEDASRLKMKDYAKSARQFGVSHMVAYHRYKSKSYVRFIALKGPQITFRILNYCRAKDIRNNVSTSLPFIRDVNSPLLVLNNFNYPQNASLKRISNLLQGMFPPLNMQTVRPEHLRRVLSFTYREENGCVYFRSYRIKLESSGVDRTISELIGTQSKVDLSSFKTFGEYLSKNTTQQAGQKGQIKQSVKLYEVGPRLKLRFVRYDDHFTIPNLEEQLAAEQQQQQQLYFQQHGPEVEQQQEQEVQQQQPDQQPQE